MLTSPPSCDQTHAQAEQTEAGAPRRGGPWHTLLCSVRVPFSVTAGAASLPCDPMWTLLEKRPSEDVHQPAFLLMRTHTHT